MIRTVKRALPVVAFIILASGALGLWVQSDNPAVLIGGFGAAVISALLFFAVIRWDEAFECKKRETLQLASVVNHAMDAMIICDTAGRILYANPSARRVFDLQLHPQRSATIEALGLNDANRDAVFAQVQPGKDWNGELVHRDARGRECTLLVNLFQLEEFQGCAPAIVGIARDCTEQKELGRKLAHSRKLAAVGELAAGVAHEINNPLSAIQNQVGLAKDLLTLRPQASDEHGEVLECIQQAGEQVRRCAGIVNSLLRFARKEEPTLRRVSIGSMIDQVLQTVRALPAMKDIEFKYSRDSAETTLDTDPGSVVQILTNLVVNASDAMSHRGTITIRSSQPSDNGITLEVVDHGCGIQPQDRERLFEPFFTTKPPGKGTGLGLSICYGLARTLGGELSLHLLSEGGTCARLTLTIGDTTQIHGVQS